MQLIKVDPRALSDNPDRTRQTKSTPQADNLLLASIKAVGIVQPPIIYPQTGGGNGYTIEAGHRRARLAIKAGLEEIDVIVVEPANDNGAMRSIVENIAREPLNSVDQWRAIERLVALGWTEDAVAIALASKVRQVKQLRLLASVLPAMLDQMAKGDMPKEQQLRTIAAAPIADQAEVWKKHKPSKASPQADWWRIAQALTKTRLYAKHASFGDDLAQAYGIEWEDDLFVQEDEDGRFTTNVEAYLGAQQEWMTTNLPKRGLVVERNTWGQPVLPPKAERVYGKPSKSDRTAMFLDNDGVVQTVHFRMPEDKKKAKGKGGGESDGIVTPKPRPDVTRKGFAMIGDFRTDALHDALARAPIEDDTLTALLVLAFAAQNVTVDSGNGSAYYGKSRLARHGAKLFDEDGNLVFDKDTLRVAARSILIEVLSCRDNRTNSGIVSRVAGNEIGADNFLANMGTEDFLLCLSRTALEAACKENAVPPRNKVRETRAALVAHFKDGHFVHPSARFAPEDADLSAWLVSNAKVEDDDADDDDLGHGVIDGTADPEGDEGAHGIEDDGEGFLDAAE